MTTSRKVAPDALTSGSIPRLIRRIALPSATAMALQTLFNVTNSYWAGTWSTEALAALATAFPIFFVVIAASFGFGQGTAALVARELGAGRPDDGRRLWAQALLLASVGGLLVTLLGAFGARTLAGLLGAREAVLELVLLYIVPLLVSAPLFLLGAVVNAALTASGDTRSLRNGVAAGTLVNAGLVPALMYGAGPLPALGVAGIAASHLAVQVGQVAWLWSRARTTELATGLTRAELRVAPAALRSVLVQVVPNTLTMLATGIGLAVVTAFAARHGPAAVAGYGIALRIEQLVLLPTLGLNAATVALVGQNLGAGRLDRVHAAARATLGSGLLLMGVGALLVFWSRDSLIAIFTDDPNVRALGRLYLGLAVLAFPAYAVVVLGAGVLQGLGRPLPALLVGIGRHVVAPPVVLWLLDLTLGLGFLGIAVGVPTVAWAGAVVTAVLLLRCLPRQRVQAGASG